MRLTSLLFFAFDNNCTFSNERRNCANSCKQWCKRGANDADREWEFNNTLPLFAFYSNFACVTFGNDLFNFLKEVLTIYFEFFCMLSHIFIIYPWLV